MTSSEATPCVYDRCGLVALDGLRYAFGDCRLRLLATRIAWYADQGDQEIYTTNGTLMRPGG